MNKNIIIMSIVLLIVLSVTLYLKYKNKITNKKIDIDNNVLKDEISKKLNKLEVDFMKIATAYYIRLKIMESEFSIDKEREILSKYPKVISQPSLNWDDFTIINEEGMILNELIEEKIQDYTEKNTYTEKDSFKYLLLEKAEKQAEEIINEKENNVQ